ncbi:MAG: DNA-protecting protein DprA [Ekhidna sp.]|nr:DNA-protecting protein DprA [Ekhidna sp.]
MSELVSQIALDLIPGIGNHGVKQLISYCGSAHEVFNAPKKKLLKIPGVGEKLAKLIVNSKSFSAAEEIISKTEKMEAGILHYTDKEYPERLKNTPDAPNLIYVKGPGILNPSRCIAIVGARKATEYGKRITEKIISDLRELDVTIVSGLAYGIDIQAHKACMNNKLPTLAILAGGLDMIYPSTHKKYAEELQNTGAILTESIPGTKPDRHLFPARNRIIAGMTDATVVVEAAEKSGALITAHIADSYNRTVFAVPGNVGNNYSEGTNRLIASQKALIYTGVEDLIYHLNWDIDQGEKPLQTIPDLPEEEKLIFELLSKENEPIEIDLIAIKTQIPINKVASLLLNLEFQNLIKSLPGKKFGLK